MKILLLFLSISCLGQQLLLQWQKALVGNAADPSPDAKQTADGINIINSTGKFVFSAAQSRINIERFANGIYIVRAASGLRKYQTKFIKR